MLKKLNDMKLRAKLMAGFGVFSAIFITTITIVFTVKLHTAAVSHQSLILRSFAELTAKNISAGLDFGDKGSVVSAFDALRTHAEFIMVHDVSGENFATFYRDPKIEDRIDPVVNEQIGRWREAKKSDWTFDALDMNCIVVPVFNSAGNEIGNLSLGMSTKSINDELQSNIIFSFILLIVTVGVGIGVVYWISGLLVRPLMNIVDRFKDIAEGEGDLTRRIHIDAKDEVGELAAAFNQFLNKLEEIMRQVARTSEQISASVESISKASSDVAGGAEQQSNQATLVAVAAEEMSATIVQTTANTGDAVRLSQQAEEATDRGKMVVEDTVNGLQNISSVVSESAQTLLELGKTVAQIGTVIEVINDIADQINLLSLNASIEAATAGDAGKGFAVVANEVKNLAEDTTRSTTEISQMIEKIQHAMANAIRAMERGTMEVEKGRALGHKTAEAFDEILKASEHVREMITNISVSSQQQSHSAEEISRNIETIAGITRNTAQGVRQIDGTTDALVNHTSALKTLVGRFKLNEQDRAQNYN